LHIHLLPVVPKALRFIFIQPVKKHDALVDTGQNPTEMVFLAGTELVQKTREEEKKIGEREKRKKRK
jgi:hypothetical protein